MEIGPKKIHTKLRIYELQSAAFAFTIEIDAILRKYAIDTHMSIDRYLEMNCVKRISQ